LGLKKYLQTLENYTMELNPKKKIMRKNKALMSFLDLMP
jgi:hypothetical protein